MYLTGRTKDLLDAVQATLGATPNMPRTMARSSVLEGWLGLLGAFRQGSINPADGERIALGVAEANGCTYCLSVHSYLSEHALKLGADEIEHARRFESGDAKSAAILAFAEAVLSSKGGIGDDDVAAARAASLNDAELSDVVGHVAIKRSRSTSRASSRARRRPSDADRGDLALPGQVDGRGAPPARPARTRGDSRRPRPVRRRRPRGDLVRTHQAAAAQASCEARPRRRRARRRLRPNLVIAGVEGLAERGWEGRLLAAGDAVIALADLRGRCIITTWDPDPLTQDVDVLRRIRAQFDGTMALNAWAARTGDVSVGDEVVLLDQPVELARPAIGRFA